MLFVSSTTGGGSGRSQRELASRLVGFGHEILFLVDDKAPHRARRWLYGHASDAAVRFQRRAVSKAVRHVANVPGRRTRTDELADLEHRVTPVPENALVDVLREFGPDVVVGNSVVRYSWRRVATQCRERGVPTVLYIREVTTLEHWRDDEVPADLVIANAQSLAEQARQRGVHCAFVPSVIDTDVTRVDSTRRVALAINPIGSKGVDLVWEVAARLPHIAFVLQESWPLSPAELDVIAAQRSIHANVEFRRAVPPGPRLYADARVVLVPYRVDSRPRVILEAQANGIPVIVADVPALVEAIGRGGVVVSNDDVAAWAAAVERLWSDERWYAGLVGAARQHGGRAEVDPTDVARRFEELVESLVTRGSSRDPSADRRRR
jgi:glycosyltransferase involved in cell wall biosynthesis